MGTQAPPTMGTAEAAGVAGAAVPGAGVPRRQCDGQHPEAPRLDGGPSPAAASIAGGGGAIRSCDAPSSVWCIDFKGKFKTGDGEWCTPFTITDAYSRFCIRCELVEEPDALAVEHILDSAFRELGPPAAIRSDNGRPFAAQGPAGLTSPAVWLLRLAFASSGSRPGGRRRTGATSDPSNARGCGHLAGTRERARAAACTRLVSSRV